MRKICGIAAGCVMALCAAFCGTAACEAMEQADAVWLGQTEETACSWNAGEAADHRNTHVLTAGGFPFTGMTPIVNWKDSDGSYYYEDLTEDGYTAVINHAHKSEIEYYGGDIDHYMSYGAWANLKAGMADVSDFYMERNEAYSEKLGCPVYVMTFKTGQNEDTRYWTMFAAEAHGYTYLYAFDIQEEANEGMDEIIADIFDRLELMDTDPAMPVG